MNGTKNHTLVLRYVAEATQQYVKAGAMREVMSLLLVSGKGAIWYGPGGHAKSQLARSVFKCIDGASFMVVNCHPDLDVADLFGGIDLNALEREGDRRIQFNVEASWLRRDIVIFEEALDTPAKTMAALKNTLTEWELQNGAQVESVDTKVLLALTNKRPADVVEMADEASRDSIAALMERFPLQVVVAWDSYEARDYQEMFDTLSEALDGCPEFTLEELMDLRQQVSEVQIPADVLAVLTELIADANEQSGGIISPRTAVHARDLIAAAAVINGRDVAVEADITAVKYLPGMEAIADTIENKIGAASNRAKAEGLLSDGFRIVSMIEALAERKRGNLDFLLACTALLQRLQDEVDDLIRPPQELASRKTALTDQIKSLIGELGISTSLIDQARVVLPEQMLGVGWKVRVEKSSQTLAEQLREREEFERLLELEEADQAYDEEDVWDDDEDDDDYDDKDDFGRVEDQLGPDVVQKLRRQASGAFSENHPRRDPRRNRR